ncbi:hypothetical protein NCCP2716_14470 [Sporosarcina sp. NCCP-2716]|uniref:hypothetical protein n=1 Tax=Sporosarcina sp. NCCP-2716 TaxID=2943679 RepID=UPI00203DE81A|nr:hypothetical protein [Sporosarcina sp. NCCP-2716]GKV68949.1 hypothetical protein NCCP2716_14470 [Sporosarcina sp. NCCP-2716]
MQSDRKSLESKLKELKRSTSDHILNLKEAIIKLNEEKTSYISYFTYSFNIAHHLYSDNMCLASYHIKNIGNKPIENPQIILKLSDAGAFSFHGKYINSGSRVPSKLKNGWIRLNDPANSQEFHLKPIEDTIILPGEMLTFSSFQIIWKPSEEYSGSITGYTHVSDMTDGVAALNAINISGTISIEEDINE